MVETKKEKTLDDDFDKLVNAALKQKLVKYFTGLILLLGAAGSTLVGTGWLESAARPNPFTAIDGDKLESRIFELENDFIDLWGTQRETLIRLNAIEKDDTELKADVKEHMRKHP